MTGASDDRQLRVLLRLATSRDATMTCDVLAREGIQCFTCGDMGQLIAEMRAGAGALVVAEEVLDPAAQAALADAVAAQPPWSDVAVLLLARPGADSKIIVQMMDRLPNVAVIERPTRVAALTSAVRSTLRARERQYEVRHLLEDLHAADKRKTEFLATLAHELRNPLAPIRTTLAFLANEKLEAAAVARYHERMRRQVDHMVRLVDDLMEVSRITRGKVDLEFVTVPLDAVIQDAVDLSRPLVESAGHTLVVDTAVEKLRVRGDAVRLTQVFANLLNNAAKYTPAGGRISVSARRDGDDAVIEVHDTGIGLEEGMTESIFDIFVQVSGTSKAAQGGLGIGLTLVRSLVALHGGRVTATSHGLGHGATFTVHLPLAVPAVDVLVQAPAQAAGWDAAVLHGTVLVVDDNRDAADSLSELLRVMGVDVVVAYGGDEALRQFSSRRIDLALLDIGMPGMDGCELAQHVRALPGGADLTLVALTGWGQESDKQRVKSVGFDHHLLKPVDLDELSTLLQKRLQSGLA